MYFLLMNERDEEVKGRGRDRESTDTDELHSIPRYEKCQVPKTEVVA
jgi:hypothetical protein